MKISEQQSEVCRQHTEALVARHVRELFKRLPMLSGFWLRFDLKVTELSVVTWPEYTSGRELYDQVTESLVQLADECPEAVRLIRGRTFARAVH